jgi:hypothetical protein
LLNAIGLQSSVFNFSKIVGPSVAGSLSRRSVLPVVFSSMRSVLCFLLFNIFAMELPRGEARKQQPGDICGHWRRVPLPALEPADPSYRGNILRHGAVRRAVQRFLPIFATNILNVGATGFRYTDGGAWGWRYRRLAHARLGG